MKTFINSFQFISRIFIIRIMCNVLAFRLKIMFIIELRTKISLDKPYFKKV